MMLSFVHPLRLRLIPLVGLLGLTIYAYAKRDTIYRILAVAKVDWRTDDESAVATCLEHPHLTPNCELIAINYGERIAINTARRPSLQECEGALRAAVKFAADSPILADTLVPTCCPTKASVPFQSLCAQVSLAELDSALACIAGARKGHGDDPCAVSECMNQDRRIPHYKSIPTSLDKSVAVKVAQYIDGCAHDAPVAYLKTVIADPVAARKDLCRNPVANAVDAMSPAAREQERELIARAEEICDAPYDAPNVP